MNIQYTRRRSTPEGNSSTSTVNIFWKIIESFELSISSFFLLTLSAPFNSRQQYIERPGLIVGPESQLTLVYKWFVY